MDAAAVGVAQKENDKGGVDQQDIFYRVVLFLAARTRGLFKRVLGADNPPFRAVMGKRGAAGAADMGAGSSVSGVITVAASVSETPSCCARAFRERVGASPRARRVASRVGKRT